MKQFICSTFLQKYYPNVAPSDPYTCEGEVDWVIEQGTDHLTENHGFGDSPELRQQVTDSLVDYIPAD